MVLRNFPTLSHVNFKWSLQVLKHTKHFPASGPLHSLSPLPSIRQLHLPQPSGLYSNVTSSEGAFPPKQCLHSLSKMVPQHITLSYLVLFSLQSLVPPAIISYTVCLYLSIRISFFHLLLPLDQHPLTAHPGACVGKTQAPRGRQLPQGQENVDQVPVSLPQLLPAPGPTRGFPVLGS